MKSFAGLAALASLILTTALSAPASAVSPLSPRVQTLYEGSTKASVQTAAAGRAIVSTAARFDAQGRVQLDVQVDCSQPTPTTALTAAGMVIGTTVRAKPLCVVEGWAALSALPAIAALQAIKTIDLPKYTRTHPPIAPRAREMNERKMVPLGLNGSPAIDGNGIAIMNVTPYIAQTGVNGAGINIGVISDDVASLSVIQARGELPASLNVIQPSANPTQHTILTDEGTMMLEEAYAVAPGANLLFCGPETAVEYLACLQNLIAAGATVVSDDLTFPGLDVMSGPSQNPDAQAVATILTASPNVMLYHSVGNDAQDYWQGVYSPLRLGGTCYPSGTQTPQNDSYFAQLGTYDSLSWQTAGGKSLYLASVLPTGQTTPNLFDLYVYDAVTSQWICSTAQSGWVDGSTSYTAIDGSSIPSGNLAIFIGTPDASLSGTLLKIIGTDDNAGSSFSPATAGCAKLAPRFCRRHHHGGRRNRLGRSRQHARAVQRYGAYSNCVAHFRNSTGPDPGRAGRYLR